MAEIHTSETSTATPPPIIAPSGFESGTQRDDGKHGDTEREPAYDLQSPHNISNAGGESASPDFATPNDTHEGTQAVAQLQLPSSQSPADAVPATAQPQPQHSVTPLKRFTSVNINKRFLEKTQPSSGASSSGGSSLMAHGSGGVGGSGQKRRASPGAARSPSTDRLAPSRLVTAKLTAAQQPSASTAGWLRTYSSIPITSTTPTPPSSSPQPPANGPIHTVSASSAGSQQSKLRPGEPSTQNGIRTSGTPSPTQQASARPVWGKIAPPSSNVHSRDSSTQINDFPTAAEAAHGRKLKGLNSQPAEAAAAQSAAQKQAMNETAAAFRGVHLDPNAHHWDEMEDEDSDFLAGVIEFGDGRQYKVESNVESAPPQDYPPSTLPPDDTTSPSKSPTSHVSKEERFGDDFDRSWPRANTSTVRPAMAGAFPPRVIPSQHPGAHTSPTDGPSSGSAHSPHDSTSPTSRVLFNERLNRLEPWSSTKPRSSHAPGPIARRDMRGDLPPVGLSRQQGPSKDAPRSHPSASNVQLLQKGGGDSTWKGGSPRSLNHAPQERGRWGAPSPTEDDHLREARRRESVSSSDIPGTSVRERSRDRDDGHHRWNSGMSDQRGRELRSPNANFPPPALPQSLGRERSRDGGRQLPPHLSQMPPPPVPPSRGREIQPDGRASRRPPAESPTTSMLSPLSPASETSPAALSVEEGIDKNSLVKDAMQLAIERAKRRKQEGEEEEKLRAEAAERARKKAEALAASQEEKKKAEAVPGEDNKTHEVDQHSHHPEVNGMEAKWSSDRNDSAATKKPYIAEDSLPKGLFYRPSASRIVNASANVPRRLPIPPMSSDITPASQADSWRSKAAPPPVSPPPKSRIAPSPPPPRGVPLPTNKHLELDLSVQPDENIEVVDFSDLGKLVGEPSSSATSPVTAPTSPTSARVKRPVAIDFFDDRPARDSSSMAKSDMSWRRPVVKTAIPPQPQSSGEDLGPQTVPIFSTDEPAPAKESPPVSDPKSMSTPSSSPSLNRHVPQGDQTGSNFGTQSVSVPPAMQALRSPRALSHFKEAPMSTLRDTMSRIKGALDGMQLQEAPLQSKDSSEQSLQSASVQTNARTEVSGSWREPREPRGDISQPASRVFHSEKRSFTREVFDITRPDLPRSPKPVWNAFVVRLPPESRPRDAISRKQLHFWNLPHAGVRWDILSWDPPVEGMNKRELSRDEIFHRKHSIKGGKIRVLLPSKRIVNRLLVDKPQEAADDHLHPVLVSSGGVKIKLPGNAASLQESIGSSSRAVSSDGPRESSVPSWRKSAMPLTQIKKARQSPTLGNGIPLELQLNTTSRSPPPEPSTPLPQLPHSSSGVTGPSAALSATVSLPTNSTQHLKASGPKRPSGTDVAFFRTSRGESGAESGKPLPRFTVNSELDRPGEPADSTKTDNAGAESKMLETVQLKFSSLRDSPSAPAAETSLPILASGNSDGKNSESSVTVTKPATPPSAHTNSAWGNSPLSFSLKESPARSAPDPEHLKAVWAQPSGRTAATTSNSLKGIADDLPSIPFTVQDMKSEDGETPPPTAPTGTPSRLSLQEVTRAFQQVPGGPAPVASTSSRPTPYASTPLLPSGSQQTYRSSQMTAISLPSQHPVRGAFAPYPQTLVGHSPSPTMMYAPGISSPVAHPRMPVNSSSPPIVHPIWLPTPPPSTQAAAFMRAGPPPPPAPMMYPSPGTPGAPGHMLHRRDSVVSPPSGVPLAPQMYHTVDMQGHMHQPPAHAQSPHHAHAHPVPHLHHMFSPSQHAQAPALYAVPIGAGRGGMLSRPGYDGMQQVPHLAPHNSGYQTVPPTSFSHPFHS